jgi:magnesium transporter
MEPIDTAILNDRWHALDAEARFGHFSRLKHPESGDFFLDLAASDQADLLVRLPADQRKVWIRLLAPDDAADVLQEMSFEDREAMLALLDTQSRQVISGLLAYAEDDAGGLMNPNFPSLRPDLGVDEALTYLRRRARSRQELGYYIYVLDGGKPIGVVSLRRLLAAIPDATVRNVMHTDVVTVRDTLDQEAVSRIFARTDLIALPVVDREGKMIGVVTVDDIVDVVQEEATEDIQKFGGMEALEERYLETSFADMVRKRAGWLAALFVGEMLTTSAMGFFEHAIHSVVVLALFVPLIISSGGNSGSQASTLVIRAMALGEVDHRDWPRVARRELLSGLALGGTLGTIGFLRVVAWEFFFGAYGPHWFGVATTVSLSLIGVVLLGTMAGSMLPFALRRAGLDPASASAPFVATFVDVTGLILYFTVASIALAGALS